MQKWLVQGLAPILCGMALVGTIMALGRVARASLHESATYRLAFADIDCQPPEGMSREDFLREVRARARQPAEFSLLQEDLLSRLHRAFAVHPWVDSVHRVEIGSERDQPTKIGVHLDLEYRRPVLAVSSTNEVRCQVTNKKYTWRMVDHHGILLPIGTVPTHLPHLVGPVAEPVGPAGSRWGDARVTAAAKTAAFLQPYISTLHLDDSELEIVQGEMMFRKPGMRVVWGHAPGQEGEGEAPAKVKLQRLLEYENSHKGLESLEHDVRLLAYQGHFPLAHDDKRIAVSLYDSSVIPSKRNWDHVSNSSRSWRSCFSDAKAAPASASSR